MISLDVVQDQWTAVGGGVELLSTSVSVLSGSVSSYGSGSGTGSSPIATVSIEEGDVLATDDTARDRVLLDLDQGFVGTLEVSFTYEDPSGSTFTESTIVQVNPTLGEPIKENDDGSMTSANLLGNNYRPSPVEGYDPDVQGDFSYTDSIIAAPWSFSGATGTQSFTSIITSTYGSEDVWSYTESVVFSYDLSSDDGAGTDQHLWGGYSYTFSVISILNTVTTSYIYSASDNYSGNVTTVTSNSTFSSSYSGSSTSMINVMNTDNAFTVDFGSVTVTNTSLGGSTGSGSYTRPLDGGVVNGTMTSTSSDFNTSTMSLMYLETIVGDWLDAGTVTMSGFGSQQYDSQGSGSYSTSSSTSNYAGSITESHGNDESYNYNGGGSNDWISGWSMIGMGHTEGGEYSKFGFSGSGSSTRTEDGATYTTSSWADGHNNSEGEYRVNYSLGNFGWGISSGTAGRSGDTLDNRGYSGSGTYDRTLDIANGTQSTSGTVSEDGHRLNESDYETSGTLDVTTGLWTWTGSGSATGSYHDNTLFSGSGTYSKSFSGSTFSGDFTGTVKEDGSTKDAGEHQIFATLVAGSWLSSGSGSGDGSIHSHYEYSAAGSYTRRVGEDVYSGTQKEDGHETSDRSYNTSSVQALSGLVTTSGSGSGTIDTFAHTFFSGAAAYRRKIDAERNEYIAGTRKETVDDTQKYNANFSLSGTDSYYGSLNNNSGDLNWVTGSGSGTSESFGYSKNNWDASASYSTTRTRDNATYFTSVFQEERGSIESRYSSKSVNEYDVAEQTWVRVSGSGTESGNDSNFTRAKHSGSYTKDVARSGNDYTANYSGTFNNETTDKGGGEWSASTSVINGDWVRISGSGSNSGGHTSIQSYTGSGSYTHNGGIHDTRLSGTVDEDSYKKDGNSWKTTLTWTMGGTGGATSPASGGSSSGSASGSGSGSTSGSASGSASSTELASNEGPPRWLESGTMSASGNSRFKSGYSATGTMNSLVTSTSTSGAVTSGGAVPTSGSGVASGSTQSVSRLLSGTVNEWGHDKNGSRYSSTSELSASGVWKLSSGSGADWGDNLTHSDYSGSGSYSASGMDTRFGTWDVNGIVSGAGHENDNSAWSTSDEVVSQRWQTVSGSASSWGDSRDEHSHSASGTWEKGTWITGIFGIAFFQAKVSGTAQDNGLEYEEDSWNIQSTYDTTAAQPSTASGAGSSSDFSHWKYVGGSSEGTYHHLRELRFDTSQHTYSVPLLQGVSMSGSATAFTTLEDFEHTTVESEFINGVPRLELSGTETPEELIALNIAHALEPEIWHWNQTGGTSMLRNSRGQGIEWEASGDFDASYSAVDGSLSWNMSGSADQNGHIKESWGTYQEFGFSGGRWDEIDYGLYMGASDLDVWGWDGSGTYRRHEVAGSFEEMHRRDEKRSFWIMESLANPAPASSGGGGSGGGGALGWITGLLTSGIDISGSDLGSGSGSGTTSSASGGPRLRGDADYKLTEKHMSAFSAHGPLSIGMTSGNFSLDSYVESHYDTEMDLDFVGTSIYDGYDGFRESSGTVAYGGTNRGGFSYNGRYSASGADGFRRLEILNFGNTYDFTNEDAYSYTYNSGSANPWERTSGSVHSGTTSDYYHRVEADDPFITDPVDYSVPGLKKTVVWQNTSGTFNYDATWSSGSGSGSGSATTSTPPPAATSGSGSSSNDPNAETDWVEPTNGVWAKSGDSTDYGNFGDFSGYSASGSFSMDGQSGTFSKKRYENSTLIYNRYGSYVASGAEWAYTGTSHETWASGWSKELHKSGAYSPYYHGSSLSGRQSTDYTESYDADYFADREVNREGVLWTVTSGGGGTSGKGDYTWVGSGTGAYSGRHIGYYYNTGETVSGTVSVDYKDHWEYAGSGNLDWNSGTALWEFSQSGTWSDDYTRKTSYTGSGSHTIGGAAISLSESGTFQSSNSASGTWNNADYEWTRSASSLNDNTWKRISDSSYDYSSSSSGSGGHYNSRSSGTAYDEFELKNTVKTWSIESEALTAGVLSWSDTTGYSSAYSTHNLNRYSHFYQYDESHESYGTLYTSDGFNNSSGMNDEREWTIDSNVTTTDSDNNYSYSTFYASGFSNRYEYTDSWASNWGETPLGGGSGSGSGSGSASGWSSSDSGGSTSSSASSGYSSSGSSSSYNTSTSGSGSGSGSGTTTPSTGDGIQRWADGGRSFGFGESNESGSGSGEGYAIALPDYLPPDVGMGNLSGPPTLTFDVGDWWQSYVLDMGEMQTELWNATTEAFAWAGDAVTDAYAAAGDALEAWGGAMADVTGVQWIDDFTGFVSSGLRAYGEVVGGAISSIPALAGAAVDYVSNMTVDDMLDVGQLALDVVGMIPVVGEVADLANGAISLGRGNYADAALSFAAMIPMAGSSATVAKWGKKIVGKADEVLAGAKWVKCKVTGTGCFVAGTKVWVSSEASQLDLAPLDPSSGIAKQSSTPLAPFSGLVVPHKSAGRNFFRTGSECVPCVGQVVTSLQADPQRLGSRVAFLAFDEAAQASDRSGHIVELWASRRRKLHL